MLKDTAEKSRIKLFLHILCTLSFGISIKEKLNYPSSYMHCPPCKPLCRTPEVSGPHFGNHCPKWLIKLLYFRVPYGHRDHRKHLL